MNTAGIKKMKNVYGKMIAKATFNTKGDNSEE